MSIYTLMSITILTLITILMSVTILMFLHIKILKLNAIFYVFAEVLILALTEKKKKQYLRKNENDLSRMKIDS